MLLHLTQRARRWYRSAAVATAIALAASAVVPAAYAAAPPEDYEPQVTTYTPPLSSAIELLQQYGLIRGDENGDLRLYDDITRAEMVTILVRMLGQENEALRLYGAAAFSDTGRHWASGYIAEARKLGLTNGYPDGTFRPNNPVTYAEALALLERAAGAEPESGTWPDAVIAQARNLDIVPPSVNVAYVPNNPAIRLHVFQALFLTGTRITYVNSGKTVFQTYLDSTPPALSVTALPSSTASDTVTVSGTAPDAAVVYVDSKQVTLNSDGSFQTQVPLVPGLNVITVEAFDAVGNKITLTVATTRASGPARIEVTGPTTVQAGSKVQYEVHIYDQNGVDLGARDLTVKIVGNIGTYDPNTNTFTAADTYATGKLIFTSGSVTKEISVTVENLAEGAKALQFGNVENGTAWTVDRVYQVRVEVLDKDGNVATSDNGRSITLTASGDPEVVITPATTTTSNGKATFNVRAKEAGDVVLEASASGLTAARATIHFVTDRHILLRSDQSVLPPDDESEAVITAYLVDQNGAPVKWDGDDDLVIKLSRSGPGRVVDSQITIPVDSYYSTDDTGLVQSRDDEGTLTVSGSVVDGPDYSVVPVSITVGESSADSSMRLEIVGSSSAEVGDTVTYTVYVRDANGNLITSGSYAFQIAINTSNDDEETDGIPDGITVSLGDTGLNPVDDGYPETSSRDGSDVIARTKNGKAIIKVSYDRSGEVTITPVPKGYAAEAYDSDGNVGAASGTTSIKSGNIKSITTAFYGEPTAVKLEVDSVLGKQQPGGALSAGSGATATIRARIVDENGNWIPGIDGYTIVLQKENGSSTTIVDSSKADAKNGYAEFKVKASSTAGTDVYSAYAYKGALWRRKTLKAYNTVAIDVEKSAPKIDKDSIIISINGYQGDDIGEYYFVGADDDGMAIALDPRAVNGEGQSVVKVYRIDGSKKTLIYTSDVVDFASGEPEVIYVPKSALKTGDYQYAVSVKNSRGESALSDPSDEVTVSGTSSRSSAATITGARFVGAKDNQENVLTVFTSSSLKCDGTINPAKLRIVAGDKEISLAGATAVIGSDADEVCTSSGSQSQFQLILTADQVNRLFSEEIAGNSPVIEADAGWYVSPSRQKADADDSGNAITNLTYVDHLEVDFANGKLYLVGGGFKNVKNLDYSKITLQKGDKELTLSKDYVSKATRQSDTVYVLTLKNGEKSSLLQEDMGKNGIQGSDVKVFLDEGWYTQSSPSSRGPSLTRKLYATPTVSLVSYDSDDKVLVLTGSGFAGGTVHPEKIHIRNWAGTDWKLSSSDKVVVTSGRIEITLTDAEAKYFKGDYLFFYGEDGWWTGALGIPAYKTERIPIDK